MPQSPTQLSYADLLPEQRTGFALSQAMGGFANANETAAAHGQQDAYDFAQQQLDREKHLADKATRGAFLRDLLRVGGTVGGYALGGPLGATLGGALGGVASGAVGAGQESPAAGALSNALRAYYSKGDSEKYLTKAYSRTA